LCEGNGYDAITELVSLDMMEQKVGLKAFQKLLEKALKGRYVIAWGTRHRTHIVIIISSPVRAT
jgi:hypothetical protein